MMTQEEYYESYYAEDAEAATDGEHDALQEELASHAASALDKAPESPTTDEDMVALLRAYRSALRALERAQGRAREYVRQVQEEIKQDLAPMEERVEGLRRSMEIFIREANGGKKFKVPGLGSAWTRTGVNATITDLDAFDLYMRGQPVGEREQLLDEPKLNKTKVKYYAKVAKEKDGEIVPGVEVEEKTTLSVRLTGGSTTEKEGA